MSIPKFPVLLTLGDLDLELLLKEMALHGDPHTSDKEFVHEVCAEVHRRRQQSSWKERQGLP